MFDNIDLCKVNTKDFDCIDYLPDFWHSIDDYKKSNDLSVFKAAIDADFSISGSVSVLPLRHTTSFAKKHYLYMDGFGLLQSDKNYYTKRENYNSYLLSFTYSGAGYLEYDDKKYYLHEGDGFFIDCRKPHFYRSEGDLWNHSDLQLNGPQTEVFYRTFAEKNSVIFSTEGSSYQQHLEKILNIYNSASEYMELLISNELYQLLTSIIVKTNKTQTENNASTANLHYLMKYIETNYNSSLSLDKMTELVNISKYHLCREFKKYSGFSPTEYLIYIRIEQAKRLLDSTNFPIAKIADLVGIPDENNFNHHFKKHEGLPPGKYRISL